MEDGVEVILNHLEPYQVKGEPFQLTLEEELRLDFEKEENLGVGLKDIGWFEADSEGNIFGIERYRSTDYIIFKFNKDGHFLKKFGRMGQGPGEIQAFSSFSIDRKNRLFIADRGNLKILEFDNDGNFIAEKSIPHGLQGLTPLENGKFLAYRSSGSPPPEGEWQLHLGLYDSDFKEIKELDRYSFSRHYKGNKNDGLIGNFRWNVTGGKIYVGNGQRGYEIWVYDQDGNLLRKIRKEYVLVKYPEEFRKQTEEIAKNRPDIYVVEYCFPFNTLFVDEDGRLYVMTFEPGENTDEYIHDIFNPDGIFIGRKSLGISGMMGRSLNATIPVCRNNRYYRLNYKESGYMELIVYKLLWGNKR
jgi:hypothetical protein